MKGVDLLLYRLQLELFNYENSVQRTIHLSKDTSFKQLHYIIQTLFDWAGIFPHAFMIYAPQENQIIADKNIVSHPVYSVYQDWTILGERDQTIGQWLHKEGDSLIYEYSRSRASKWLISINLLGQVEPQADRLYPYCESASRVAPIDSLKLPLKARLEGLDYDLDDDLSDTMNQFLLAEDTVISCTEVDQENFYKKEVAKLVKDFMEAMPWLDISENQIFVIRDPETDEKLFCSINGADGQEPGMGIFIGEDSFIKVHKSSYAYFEEQDQDQAVESLQGFHGLGILIFSKDSIMINNPKLTPYPSYFEELDDLPEVFSLKNDSAIPEMQSVEEMRLMVLVLKQTLEIHHLVKQGLHLPAIRRSSNILERIYSPNYRQFINNELRLLLFK